MAKRILFLNEGGQISGIENVMADIMTRLDPARFIPLVACPPGPFADRITRQGIQHIPFTFHMRRLKLGQGDKTRFRPINPLAILQKYRESFALARLIREQDVDILHTNSLSAHVAGLFAARRAGVPIVWHIHTYLPRLLYRFLLPDRIVFVSEAVRRASFPGSIPPVAQMIYNGIDFSRFAPDEPPTVDIRQELGLAPGQPLVALIGHLDPTKGQHEMIAAWPQIHTAVPDARLLLVGKPITLRGPAYAQSLQNQVHDLQIQDSVIFTGFRGDIPAILHGLDIFVSFTLNDTLSVMVIEAMSMRKAIIGANSGGLPELIVPGESGLLVDNGDIEGLAAAVIRLLGDPALREAYGRAARQRALERFQIQRCVDEFQAVYEEMLQGRP